MPIDITKESEFIQAVFRGDVVQVNAMLDENPRLAEKRGVTYTVKPLEFACWKGGREVTDLLIRRGARPKKNRVSGDTLLHIAAKWNKLDIIEMLIDEHGMNPFEKNNDGHTFIYYLAKFKHGRSFNKCCIKYGIDYESIRPVKEHLDTMSPYARHTVFSLEVVQTLNGVKKWWELARKRILFPWSSFSPRLINYWRFIPDGPILVTPFVWACNQVDLDQARDIYKVWFKCYKTGPTIEGLSPVGSRVFHYVNALNEEEGALDNLIYDDSGMHALINDAKTEGKYQADYLHLFIRALETEKLTARWGWLGIRRGAPEDDFDRAGTYAMILDCQQMLVEIEERESPSRVIDHFRRLRISNEPPSSKEKQNTEYVAIPFPSGRCHW